MCLPVSGLARPRGASLALLLILMEYPLPGPVIALLSQERAALAPKSYLISSCKKSIKITLVYAKDQQSEEQQSVPAALATAAVSDAAAAASTSRASSASPLRSSSSSSLSSSAERKKPRHASSSSKQNRKKKKKSKSSRKSSRSTPSGIMMAPRVSKLSESSSSPTSDLDALCSGGRGGGGGGGVAALSVPRSQTEIPGRRREDSCSTPEFPLLFGGHDEDMIGRERMSTVDSGVPSSNGTVAYEQTAESGASDEDHDTQCVAEMDNVKGGPGLRRDKPQPRMTARDERIKAGIPDRLGQVAGAKANEGARSLQVDLPRRTRGISDSSLSSLSSSDEDEGTADHAKPPTTEVKNTTTPASTGATTSTSVMGLGPPTPVRREEQWQTWTRIPRTQAPSTSARQKLMAVPSISSRPPAPSSASGAGRGGVSRGSADHNNQHDAAAGSRANQNEGGASWDGSDNL